MESKYYRESERERQAREKGKALPHYTRKVARELTRKPKSGAATPSKRDKN
jgi:hypothetical protein